MTAPRRATVDDADAIAALVRQAYLHYIPRIGRKPAPMLDDYRQVVAGSDTFVLEDEGVIAGVIVMRREGGALLLANIAVLPRLKGRGIGKALMAFCEEHARSLGCAAVRLYTHELMVENIALYHKLGYRETHRAIEDGFARVFMRRDLTRR